MAVYSATLCGKPWNLRDSIELQLCMGKRMMPSTLQCTVRENIAATPPPAQQDALAHPR